MPNEQEEFRSSKRRRRSFATAELSDKRAEAVGASRMDDGMRILTACLNQNSARRQFPHSKAPEVERAPTMSRPL